MLDRESVPEHTIRIIADRGSDGPPDRVAASQLLLVTIIVLDVNDNWPVFEDPKFYAAGITTSDYLDKFLFKIVATDADLNDTLTYNIKADSMQALGNEIESVKDSAFSLNSITGDISLTFEPQSYMTGYFQFIVEARDEVDHTDEATVKIYIISDINRVSFIFMNSLEIIEQNLQFVSLNIILLKIFYN